MSRTALPSPIWRLIADYSGVSYKAAFEKWVTEIERKIKEEEGGGGGEGEL